MRLAILALILCATQSALALGARQLPRDIQTFVKNAEACEHLGGEYDGELPKGQKQQIIRSVRRYCGAARRQLAVLKQKYRDDQAMLEVIDSNANDAVTSYR